VSGSSKSTRRKLSLATVATLGALVAIVPSIAGAQESDGFDGFIQSGTCVEPTDDLRVELGGYGDHDVEPYLARTGAGDETVVLGYFGSPRVWGFGFPVIYTDQPYSLVITGDGGPVACGEILRPDEARFGEAGLALVQLLPVEGSTVQGFALVDRGPLQRELDVAPTRVRVLLSTEGGVTAAEPVDGYDGYIQDGTCDSPGDRLQVRLRSLGDHDVVPYLAQAEGSGEPVTVASYGAPRAPGFGVAAAYTDESFSLAITDTDSGDPLGCGDILVPDEDAIAEAGLALVQILPVGDAGVQGFAVIERTALERESDITPTRVRVLLFAPPVA
jgi:hypothetical protein